MTMFGLKEAEVSELIRPLAGIDLDRAAIEERFARATWSGLAEPGDRVAGALIDVLGAPGALTALIERGEPESIAVRLTEVSDNDSELEHRREDAVEIASKELAAGLERWRPRLKSAPALIALRQAVRLGVALRVPSDENWPRSIDDLRHHAPIALWTRGRAEILEGMSRSIALVGARAATGYGEHVTVEASAGLVDRGYTIVSGAAYGIDGTAHRAALASGGNTVAFLAGGVDRFYPSGHEQLLGRIVDHGMVLSELPCGAAPTRWRFLQRNRLIAAAGQATVVLEAGWRSGSINTAHHALDLVRPVGAVPGPVTSAASAGCHRLIRDFGAVCVTTPDEMAELAPWLESGGIDHDHPRTDAVGGGLRAENTRVVDAMSARSPRSVDDIALRSGLSPQEVRSELGRMQLGGTAHDSDTGWITVVRRS